MSLRDCIFDVFTQSMPLPRNSGSLHRNTGPDMSVQERGSLELIADIGSFLKTFLDVGFGWIT